MGTPHDYSMQQQLQSDVTCSARKAHTHSFNLSPAFGGMQTCGLVSEKSARTEGFGSRSPIHSFS